MIDKLLARIARRGSPEAHATPISVLVAGSHGEGNPLSSGGTHDPFSMAYPAPGRLRSARSGHTRPGANNAWLLASDAYVGDRMSGGRIPDQPAFFAGWGPAHMAVAQMLWAEQERLHLGQARIQSGAALVAVVLPVKKQVLIQATAYQAQQALSLFQLPQGQSNGLPAGKEWVSHTLYSLLWFYGQVYSAAPELLPQEMGQQLIQLRRFPPVEPAALEMRHLALLHVFSGGALSFAQLQRQVPAEQLGSLCADLASLYFTGSLRLLP
jgi:hypothetical protein